MPTPANDASLFKLERNEDGIWLIHPDCPDRLFLGPFEAAAEAMTEFLADQDFGELAAR